MLDKLDLTASMDEGTFEEVVPPLKKKLARLQREARDADIPVVVIFEGLNTIGLGFLVNEFMIPMDPRGFSYHYVGDPNDEERERPFMWRFWMMTPSRGIVTVLDRSYYSRSLIDRCSPGEYTVESCAESFRWFERQLMADGAVLVKLFLHMGHEEQRRRMDDPMVEEMMSCGFLEEDLRFQEGRDRYLPLFERLIEETDTDFAPWTIVEANDRNFALAKIFSTVTDSLERGIAASGVRRQMIEGTGLDLSSVRGSLDLSVELPKEDYKQRKRELQSEVKYVQCELHRQRVPLVVLFEGWDAAGKGGAIKRLTQNMSPRTYNVVPVFAPTGEERRRHYLVRFMDDLPRKGNITIFDRSWYGRVLVERVEGFATEAEWRRAYRELNEFEEMLVNDGAILVKFWLEVDKKEQLKRFKAREKDPSKEWKMTDEDWRNRERWEDYSEAVDEMLLRTSTTFAPWTIVESNDKRYSRVKVLSTVVDVAKERLGLE